MSSLQRLSIPGQQYRGPLAIRLGRVVGAHGMLSGMRRSRRGVLVGAPILLLTTRPQESRIALRILGASEDLASCPPTA